MNVQIILALFSVILSGAAGLIYEVAWHKYLCNLLGSQAKASAIILSVFLGGLSLGYLLFGKISKDKDQKSLITLGAWIEIGIGTWAIFFPMLYIFVWDKLKILPSSGILAFVLEILISCFLILLPTTLMGSTLPLLTKGLSENTSRTKNIHALIYSINTFGAFFGTLAAGFYILPKFGLSAAVQGSSILNFIAGILLLFCSKLTKFNSNKEEISSKSNPLLDFNSACIIVFILGFCSICLQTCLIRIFSMTAGSSEYSFTIVVSVFVLLLAIGAHSVRKAEINKNSLSINLLFSIIGLFLIYLTAENWPYYCYVIRVLLKDVEANFYFYNFLLLISLSSVCILAVGFLGRSLPLVFATVVDKYENSGNTVGVLYSLNALGCIMGATIGGYLLLYIVDLYFILKICIVLVTLCIPKNRLLNTIIVISLLAFLKPWDPNKLSSGIFRHRKISSLTFQGPSKYYENTNDGIKTIFSKDDPNSSVRIIESKADMEEEKLNHGANFVRALYVNGKSDGQTSFGDMNTMRLVAHLPALLLAEEAKNVAVIGLGLGVSAGTIAKYSEVQKLDIVEISEALAKNNFYFDFANNELSKNTKKNLTIGDAYRVLGGSDSKYSLILSEPSNPWVTGVERLYTKEYYEIIKNKLTDNGIYAQWFHTYYISEKTLGIVLSTFGHAFENTRLFVVDSDIIVLGSKQKLGLENIKALKTRYASNQFARDDLRGIKILNIESLLSLEAWLPTQLYADETEHTLEFPILSYAAGKDFFLGNSIEYSDLLQKQDYAPWIRRKMSDILFSYYLLDENDKIESLTKYTNAACKKFALFDKLPNKLNLLPPHCKEPAIALSLAKKIDYSNILNDSEATLIKKLVFSEETEEEEKSWSELGRTNNINDLRKLIALFNDYDSSFTPLSPKKLILATEKCFTEESIEADSCKSELIIALANRGWGVLATNYFNKLSEQQKREKVFLNNLVKASFEAEYRMR